MYKTVALALLGAAVCLAAPPTCNEPNQVYSACGALEQCQRKCGYTSAIPCPKICVAGCICQGGYVRDDAGRCVSESACQASTSCSNENEVYSHCGAMCQRSCGDPQVIPCPRICMHGCVCKPGFVRDTFNRCVKEEGCTPKPTCDAVTEEFTQCGAACQKTCDNPNPMVCPMICMPGCLCKEGFARHPTTKKCIKAETCGADKCTKKNEVFTTCGSVCQPRCNVPLPPFCSLRCFVGCVCEPGFYRNTAGECVTSDGCGSDHSGFSSRFPRNQSPQCAREQTEQKAFIGMLGKFVPSCKPDGSYEEKQCHGSTGFCWCVDNKTGVEIPNTRQGPGAKVEC